MTATATPEAPTLDSVIGELVKVLRSLGREDLVGRARPPRAPVCTGRRRSCASSASSSRARARSSTDCSVPRCARSTTTSPPRRSRSFGTANSSRPSCAAARATRPSPRPSPSTNSAVGCRSAATPGNEKRVERVEITAPSAILRQGLALVDTPGMGGLGAGHAAATLSFLPFADGLILASDASAELSAPEVEFLQRAVELCPTVLFAQTKTDLYPAWERIVDINQGTSRAPASTFRSSRCRAPCAPTRWPGAIAISTNAAGSRS